MSLSIAHLGPPGTYAEQAAVLYVNWLTQTTGTETMLCPYPSIAQSLQALAAGKTQLAVVPAENSIEGSVTMTMDTLWQLDSLQIHSALVLPIAHTLISCAASLDEIKTVYSHPQALAQCQGWLGASLPNVQLIPINSTTEALQELEKDLTIAAIASSRAAELYNLPILARNINDYPDNCTRFWVVSQAEADIVHQLPKQNLTHTSIAFSVPTNVPGALLKALEVFANLGINMNRIESRPTKRSLGEYLFFVDIEADVSTPQMKTALVELTACTEVLKIFGSYNVLSVGSRG
ncbi:MAG TPA: prephenate dehydratase [Leptolyngbyaceae cyanobacterium]